MNAALLVVTTAPHADRHIAAMLALCERSGWRIIAQSTSARALVALVAAGAVEVVVGVRWDPVLARAVESAGGQLEAVRGRPKSRCAGLADTIGSLAAAGKLSDGDVSELLAAAGLRPERDDPQSAA